MEKRIVSIASFGAVPDAEQLQTEKIQAAIDFCFEQGGGEVVIPEGTYRTGGIRLRSNITLHLMTGAVLKGSRNPEDYFEYLHDTVEPLPDTLITKAGFEREEHIEGSEFRFIRTPGSRWNNALIRAVCAENVSIIGEEGSYLDGSDCFDEKGEEGYRGPHCINMYYCRNITLRGYTVKDSANWAHAIFYSDNIIVRDVTVLAGHDGVHVTACRNVEIDRCSFYTGDDCVAGFANVNVSVTGCELNSACSALRFGGTNVLVENCHMYGPCRYLFRGSLSPEEKRNGAHPTPEGHRNNMLSVFTYYADPSFPIPYQPGNIIIRGCRVDYADRFLHYNYSGNEIWQKSRPLESIRFENLQATDISMPLTAYGDKNIPVTLEIVDVDISIRKGSEHMDFMHAANYKKITLKNVNIQDYRNDTLIKTWTDGDIEIKDLRCGVAEDKYVTRTDERFVCQPI